jgi:hypothetical protein
MLLRVIDDDADLSVETVEVSFEQGKYIRRMDDVKYLHVNKDDELVDWADSSHTLNEWFEFTIEPKTHVIRTHEGQCLIWTTDLGSLVKTNYPHQRAVIIESTGLYNLKQAKANFFETMEVMVPETLTTKRERIKFLNAMWKTMSVEEKTEYF